MKNLVQSEWKGTSQATSQSCQFVFHRLQLLQYFNFDRISLKPSFICFTNCSASIQIDLISYKNQWSSLLFITLFDFFFSVFIRSPLMSLIRFQGDTSTTREPSIEHMSRLVLEKNKNKKEKRIYTCYQTLGGELFSFLLGVVVLGKSFFRYPVIQDVHDIYFLHAHMFFLSFVPLLLLLLCLFLKQRLD